MAPPTEVGSADAMFAKMSTDVPLPSFSSVIVSATCTRSPIVAARNTAASTCHE